MNGVWNMRQVWRVWLLVVAISVAGCAGLGVQGEIAGLMKQGQQLYTEKKYDEAIDKFAEVVTLDTQYWQAYLWAARAYIAKGNWPDAISKGKQAYTLAPKSQEVLPVFAEALFGGGSDALKNGRFAESVGHFVEFIKLEPGNARAWLSVGKAYLGQKQFRQALSAFSQGLANSTGPERTELVRGLLDGGIQAFSSGKNGEAIDLLKEFLKYDKKDIAAYVNLAKAYWASGEITDAIDAFRKVLKLDPRHEEALKFLMQR